MSTQQEDPYAGVPPEQWLSVTERLVDEYPLRLDQIKAVVLESWEKILDTKIGGEFKIGEEYKPTPQIMGDFLHLMIPVVLEKSYPSLWRKDQIGSEKDLIYIPDRKFDTEIKTSSSKSGIFGNRSYAQPSTAGTKDKSGYYLAINFDNFRKISAPKVTKVRLGWLSHRDWNAQKSATGQQASLSPITYKTKFVEAL